jgi:hypothetical protein
MKKVFKYAVPMADYFTLEAPKGAEFLSVQLQGPEVQVWARVDPDAYVATYQFAVHGTGHKLSEFSENAPFIGTFQLHGGALVFHLFGGLEA